MLSNKNLLCLLDLFFDASYFLTSFPYLLVICLFLIWVRTKNNFSASFALRFQNRKSLWRNQVYEALRLSALITGGEIIPIMGYAVSMGVTKYNWNSEQSYFFLNTQQTLQVTWWLCLLAYIVAAFLFGFGCMICFIVSRWIFDIPVISWISLLILFYGEYFSKHTLFFQNLCLKYEDWIEEAVRNKLLMALLIIAALLAAGEGVSSKKEFYVR